MRILVNARFLLPGKLEGIGLYTYEILKGLIRQHPDDQFILCIDRRASMKFDFGDNARFHLVRPPARHPFLFIWWFEIGIPRAYRKYKADLFFSPDGFLSTSLTIEKSILVIHDLAYLHYPDQINWLARWYYRRFMPQFIERANKIIAVSHSTKNDIVSNFPHASSKVSVVYNGVRKVEVLPPPDSQDTPPIPLQEPYFICVGSIHPRKNIGGLLDAFAQFKSADRRSTKLIIVGRMAWKTSEISQKFNNHPNKQDIILTGYLPDSGMFRLLKGSVALIYVSLFEGFGLPIVEAMHNDIPVITSNRSSMQEIAGNAALMVDPESPDSIAEAMTRLLEDSDLHANLILKGRERIKVFNWDDAVEAISQSIQDL